MNDEAMELLRECRSLLAFYIEEFSEHGNDTEVHLIQDMIARIDAIPATQEPKAAPRGKLSYDRATRTIRDERGKGVLVLTEEDADMFASAAPDSGEMPEEPEGYSGGWGLNACEAELNIWKDYAKRLRSYALSLREQREGMVTGAEAEELRRELLANNWPPKTVRKIYESLIAAAPSAGGEGE